MNPADQSQPKKSEMNTADKPKPEKMRIDKWLWCARFYKTRSLATQAVESGKVRLNESRVKPAHDITPSDRLSVQIGEFIWQIEILGISPQRSAAPIAQTLYHEEEASLARRQQQIAEHKAAINPDAQIKGRPTKRDRRQIHRFIQS